MKGSQQRNELKARDEKIKLMNDRQKQWMEERRSTKSIERPNNMSQGKSTYSAQGNISQRSSKSKKQSSSSEKKSSNEMLLWTAKSQDAINDGFVVRKPPGKYDGRTSSRSSKSSPTSQPGTGRTTARIKGERGVDKYDTLSKNERLTSTPDRGDNAAKDLQLSKDISSIRIANESKNIKQFDTSEMDKNNYDKFKYSSFNAAEMENRNGYMGLSPGSNFESINETDIKLNKQKGSSIFAMHCCPLCKKLMSIQSHRPFLIIPCGHNVCAQCQPSQTVCPTCSAKVLSSVENTTLSHVIKEYKKQEEREELARKEQEARKFVEEYDSLKTRCDVLSCKAEVVIESLESITANLVQTKKNMKATDERKAELLFKINTLQEELSTNEAEHKNQQQICSELEISYSKEKENLDMIENTLDRVKQSKERVRQLVLNYIPTFRFEDD